MAALHLLPSDSGGIPTDIDDQDLVLALAGGAMLRAGARDLIEQLPSPLDAVFGDVEVRGRICRRGAWSPTRALTDPTTVLPIAVRASTLRSLGVGPADPGVAVALTAAGARVAHIPQTLTSHTVALPCPTRAQLDRCLETMGVPARVEPGLRTATFRVVPEAQFSPSVTIVIPTAGARLPHGEPTTATPAIAVERCLSSLPGASQSVDVVLVVGDEYDGDPTAISAPPGLRTRLVTRPAGPFSFSEASNLGLLAATGEFVLFLNDDTEAADPGFVLSMAIHLTDPGVGIVGAELLYPDGTIQHTGIVVDDAHALHPFVGKRPEEVAAHGADVARDAIAVTGACLMARRADLLAVGGLSTDFPMSFNDVDLCMRMRRTGRRVIIEPGATLVHHETLTRAPDIESWEWDRWIQRWGEVTDPWYHPAFHRPDDPEDLRRNADHLPPRADDLQRLAQEPLSFRTPVLRSRVHRGRPAPSVT